MSSRLTAGGWVLLALAAVAGLAGAAGRYVELLALAAVLALALAVALLVPRLTSPIELDRSGVPKLVPRGSSLTGALTVRAAQRVPPVRIIDQFSGTRVGIDLPAVIPGRDVVVRYRLEAARRGVQQLGPILEERTDPLGLVVRSIGHDVIDEVLVHPVVHRLRVATAGHRERQRANQIPRLSDDPLAEFRALREYQPGDDPRMVHWASTARAGTLVVKDFLELRRATRTVILDTAAATLSAELFEEAVEVAASLAVDALDQATVLTVRTTDAEHPGHPRPVTSRTEVLELFTRVRRTSPADTLAGERVRPPAEAPDQTFLVMGRASPLLGVLGASQWTRRSLSVVRVAARRSDLPRLPFPTFDVPSARDLRLAPVGR